MTVGHVDEEEQFFCAGCWANEMNAGRRPMQVLNDEEADGPVDNFWLVDECVQCARAIKVQGGEALGVDPRSERRIRRRRMLSAE
jgi:hypothetical protein